MRQQYGLAVNLFMILMLMLVINIGGCGGTKSGVTKDIVKTILYDVYTPKSMEEFYRAKDHYIKDNILSQDEADALFATNGATELTEKDLARKLEIINITKSSSSDNTVGTDLYKCDCSLHYDGSVTNFEILFTTNTSGVITRHDIKVK